MSKLNDLMNNPDADLGGMELFRDRRPFQGSGTDAKPERPEPEPIDVSQITAATLRDTLLASIGIAHRAATAGELGNQDSQMLERVLNLTRDFPLLAKALEDMQAHGSGTPEAAAEHAPRSVPTSETVRVLRALKGIKGGKAG